jgi:dihydrofolate reductase
MRRLTYYIGCSLDGFIAGPDGETDSSGFDGDLKDAILSEYPETIPTHAREALGLADVPNKVFDTILMGRATYEPALRIGVTSPYPHLRQYVFSSTLPRTDPEVEVVSGNPVELVRGLKRQPGAGIIDLLGAGEHAGDRPPTGVIHGVPQRADRGPPGPTELSHSGIDGSARHTQGVS